MFSNKQLYNCTRCNETFWLEIRSIPKCVSCGNTLISKKTITFDVNNKSLTIENIVHNIKDKGIVRINILGERKKALFSCKKCGSVFESDCTHGINTVSCINCKTHDLEIKSPIASVVAGIKGIPPMKRNWTKTEIKIAKFAKNCYKNRLQVENYFNNLINCMSTLSIPKRKIAYIKSQRTQVLKWIDKYHEEKIEEYEKQINNV